MGRLTTRWSLETIYAVSCVNGQLTCFVKFASMGSLLMVFVLPPTGRHFLGGQLIWSLKWHACTAITR